MSRCFGPFEVYSLNTRWHPRIVQARRLNAYGPPPHGFVVGFLCYRLVVWFPRNWRIWNRATKSEAA